MLKAWSPVWKNNVQLLRKSVCREYSLLPAPSIAVHSGCFAPSLNARRLALFMPVHKVEERSPQRANKRRRITASPCPHRENMAVQTEEIPQPLPKIELTPLEHLIERLLLDVKNYIEQKNENESTGQDAQQEMVLRFTGGWVRDKLLGVDSHDIDVAISTMTGFQFGNFMKEYLDDPENLAKYKGNNNPALNDEEIVKVHKIDANPEKSKHLETVTTRIFGLDIDLVNLRKETYTDDSRNPQMEFGTAEEDALRRDATVNAMFYNLNTSTLEDLTTLGLQDLKQKLIRTPLEAYQTFKDDPLRILRLIRFASRLGYRIDDDSKQAMQNESIRDALRHKISKERVGAEVEKMLRGKLSSACCGYNTH